MHGQGLSKQDSDLVTDLQNGSPESYSKVVDLYGGCLRRFLWARFKTGLSREDIEDVVYDAIYSAIKAIDSFNPNTSGKNGFRNWLFTIGYRKCLDLIKSPKSQLDVVYLNDDLDESAKHYHPGSEFEPDPNESVHPNNPARVFAAQRVLDEMAPEKRAILFMNEVQGISSEEIARFQNEPVGTIRTRLTRAKDDFYNRILKQPEFADWAQQMPLKRPSKQQ